MTLVTKEPLCLDRLEPGRLVDGPSRQSVLRQAILASCVRRRKGCKSIVSSDTEGASHEGD
jgi:hypothetical protein